MKSTMTSHLVGRLLLVSVLVGCPVLIQAAASGNTSETIELTLNQEFPLAPAAPSHASPATVNYRTENTRDPFIPILSPRKITPFEYSNSISGLTLIGVLEGGLGTHALFTDRQGTTLKLAEQDLVFDGKLTTIQPDYVIFHKNLFDSYGRLTGTEKIRINLRN